MDVIFGSQGVAEADMERMNDINIEIGLEALLRRSAHGSGAEVGRTDEKNEKTDEKTERFEEKEAAPEKPKA